MMERKVRADVALAFCSLLWGATFVVVRNVLDHISVFLFLAVRFSVAAVLMAALRPSSLRHLKRDELFAGAALGFFMFGGYAFQTAGLLYTTPAKSGFVTGSSVVLVPLLLGIFWKRRLTAWTYGGTVAAVAGERLSAAAFRCGIECVAGSGVCGAGLGGHRSGGGKFL